MHILPLSLSNPLSTRLSATVLSSALLLTVLSPGVDAAPLQVTHFNPGADSIFPVTSSFISGEHELVLVDAQFQTNDAQTLVDTIKASGKRLTKVFISHGDPDFYFGLALIRANFPKAEILATPSTRAHIQSSMASKLAYWGPILKDNAPKELVLPEAITGDSFSVDGETVRIIGYRSQDPEHSFLWVPSAKTITGGVEVFDGMHMWMADTQTKASRQNWLQHLDTMLALQPEAVIPGHYLVNPEQGKASLDKRAITATRDYVQTFEQAASQADNAAQLIHKMQQSYPEYRGAGLLDISAKVIMGEMAWPQ
ncbi:MBL fold metallo-hydrolase [Shewanella salipaludis]|uniref:MBL fold metallo-hydrolase n=1 Tax=Shewanella salipaludis TaxID=2723052 RepID=A0A972FTA2_9GAMM|nr:MBL fold metallo-hydrolase [Shewanella salipaludis]